MFKLFRQYNKYILAFGVTFLMIIFLAEGALMRSQSRPTDEEVGTLDGRKVIVADLQHAQSQIVIVQTIHNALPMLASSDPLGWYLMQQEADKLGVSASEAEVDSLLKSLQLDDDAKLMERFRDRNVSLAMVRAAVREWIALQHYRELVLGRSHSPVEMKLQGLQFANMMMQMGRYNDIGLATEMTRGIPRMSDALIAKSLQDEAAVVRMTAIKVGVEEYLGKVSAPDEKLMNELFTQYKELLPRKAGEPAPVAAPGVKIPADPHGFGYRLPDMAKLEYIAIPEARIAATIEVDEADLLTYYNQNKSQFIPASLDDDKAAATKPALPPKPYESVRDQIERQIQAQRARELGDRIAATVVSQLSAPLKALPDDSGYKKLPEGFKGPALSAVAESIQKQFGVLPDVQRIEDRWLDRDAVEALPGFGRSFNMQAQVLTSDYVFSAREFAQNSKTEVRDSLRRLRLQVATPSATVTGMDGTRYIFRVTAVQPSRTPQSLDEVRGRVAADAVRLQAYRLLLADREALVKRLLSEAPNDLAKSLGTERLSPEFSRRALDRMTGDLSVPDIKGIGRDEAFVDAVFALAEKAGGTALSAKPAADRVGAVPMDSQMALVLIRFEDFRPMKRSEFEAQAGKGFVSLRVASQLSGDSHVADPFSVESLSKRLKFVSRQGKHSGDEKTAPAEENAEKSENKG